MKFQQTGHRRRPTVVLGLVLLWAVVACGLTGPAVLGPLAFTEDPMDNLGLLAVADLVMLGALGIPSILRRDWPALWLAVGTTIWLLALHRWLYLEAAASV